MKEFTAKQRSDLFNDQKNWEWLEIVPNRIAIEVLRFKGLVIWRVLVFREMLEYDYDKHQTFKTTGWKPTGNGYFLGQGNDTIKFVETKHQMFELMKEVDK